MNRLAVALFAFTLAMAASAQAASPPAPGRYCSHEELLVKGGGKGGAGEHSIGRLWMILEVENRADGPFVSLMNVLPDTKQSLVVGPSRATPGAAGDLAFAFTDKKGNKGWGTFSASGEIDLMLTEPADPAKAMEAGRNYLRLPLSRSACTAKDLRTRLGG